MSVGGQKHSLGEGSRHALAFLLILQSRIPCGVFLGSPGPRGHGGWIAVEERLSGELLQI